MPSCTSDALTLVTRQDKRQQACQRDRARYRIYQSTCERLERPQPLLSELSLPSALQISTRKQNRSAARTPSLLARRQQRKKQKPQSLFKKRLEPVGYTSTPSTQPTQQKNRKKRHSNGSSWPQHTNNNRQGISSYHQSNLRTPRTV